MKFYPTHNGVLCQEEYCGVFSMINAKASHVIEKRSLKCKSIYHKDIPFLRGLEFIFFGTYLFFISLIFSISMDNSNNKLLDNVSKRLNVNNNVTFISTFFVIVFLFSIILFVVLPTQLTSLFANYLPNEFAKNLINANIKFLIFLIVLFCFKNILSINRIYAFNTAANIIINRSLKNKSLISHTALNYLNFLVSGLMFNIFFTTLMGIEIFVFYKLIIDIILYIIGFSIVYELLFLLEKSKIKCIIILSSFFVTTKSNATSELIVATSIWEMKLIKENQQRNQIDEKEDKESSSVFLSQVLAFVDGKLKENNILEENESKWLVANVLGVRKNELKFISQIKKTQEMHIKKILERRIKGEPLDKIFGECEFFSQTIKVSKNVLTPRPETELLVEKCLLILKNFNKPTVLDLCTGSGAIAIAIKQNCEMAKVYACDISDKALAIAKENAKHCKLKIHFKKSDMFLGLNKRKKYDMIISNPPYIKSSDIPSLDREVRLYDPLIALDGGDDGLRFYRIIAKDAPCFLKKNGILALEIGYDQGKTVKKLLSKSLKDVTIIKDYSGNDRFVIAKNK